MTTTPEALEAERAAATLQSELELIGDEDGHATNTGLSNEKLAMWAFLGSECLLFGALISTYFLYRGRSVTGPTPKQVYDIPYTSISSFVLLMSSLTMVLALAAIQRGDHRRLRLWLTATALLGTGFIGGPGFQVPSLIHHGRTG